MAVESINRTGRVSAINYEAGTYTVVYQDRGRSVTKEINAMSHGEYMMPQVGDIVAVSHNSNGTIAGTTLGNVWNKTNKPKEGYKGLYRKEYSNSYGQAYSRYDSNTGVYQQFTPTRTGRTTNGEIFDEAQTSISLIAEQQLQLKSNSASASIMAAAGVGISAGTNASIEAGEAATMEAGKSISFVAGTCWDFVAGPEQGVKWIKENCDVDKIERKYKVKETIKEDIQAKTSMEYKYKTDSGDVVFDINTAKITVTKTGEITIKSPVKVTIDAPAFVHP